MSDRFVTVASYTFPPEAQMAKNLLEAEGIPAVIAGEMTGDILVGMGDPIHLQVRAVDARRAVSILAVVASEAGLDDDWEQRAESGAGVWVCSLCGAPVGTGATACPACGTPRTGIQTGDRSPSRPPSEAIQARDQVTASAPPPPRDRIISDAPSSRADEHDGPAPQGPRPSLGCAVLFVALALLALGLLPV
jgi:hypothetical protein